MNTRLNLLCIDGTTNSANVISWYCIHHHRQGDEVGLIHLYSLPGLNFMLDDDEEKVDKARKEMDAILLEVKDLKKKFIGICEEQIGVTPHTFFENSSDNFGRSICQIAEKNQLTSMIVMSQAGLRVTGCTHDSIQVAKYLSTHATVPLLLMPAVDLPKMNEQTVEQTVSNNVKYNKYNPKVDNSQVANNFNGPNGNFGGPNSNFNGPSSNFNGQNSNTAQPMNNFNQGPNSNNPSWQNESRGASMQSVAGGFGPMRQRDGQQNNNRYNPMSAGPSHSNQQHPNQQHPGPPHPGPPHPNQHPTQHFDYPLPFPITRQPAHVTGPPFVLYCYHGHGFNEVTLFKMLGPYGRVQKVECNAEKGFAFAHFLTFEEAQSAIEGLNGLPKEGETIHGTKQRYQFHFAENSRVAVKPPEGLLGPPFLVYVGANRHLDKEIMYRMFGRFGRINDCQPKMNYGFVHFRNYEEAQHAVDEMDGTYFEDGIKPLTVKFKNEGKTGAAAKTYQDEQRAKMRKQQMQQEQTDGGKDEKEADWRLNAMGD